MKHNSIIYSLHDNNYNHGVLEMKFIRNFFIFIKITEQVWLIYIDYEIKINCFCGFQKSIYENNTSTHMVCLFCVDKWFFLNMLCFYTEGIFGCLCMFSG